MVMPGRKYAAGTSYRYGFNGKEKDNEVKGEGNEQDYGMRIYDPRLGRFLSVDPLTTEFPWNTPYDYAENDPVGSIDFDGLEKANPKILEYAKQISDYHSDAIIRDKNLLSQTTDKKIIAILNTQLDYHKKVYAALVKFRYINRYTEDEKALYQLFLAGPYLEKTLDVSPAGDVKVLVTGTNFSGEEQSRWKAAGFLVIDFFGGEIIGVAGKTVSTLGRGVRYANKFGKCVEFASEFISKYSKGLKKAGAEAKVYEINVGKNGLIGTAEQQFSNNGMHQFVEVVKDGKSWIFDNLHPDGVLKSDYVKALAAHTADNKVIEGEKLLEQFTKEVVSKK
jgi:RHS repeat-associated protein